MICFYKIDYNVRNMKKLFILLLIILPFNLAVAEKQTTFDNGVFNKAQSDGKTVVVSSWIKYCTSCASQMKALKDVEKDFDNLIYLTFDVTNREIAKQLNIQFQTTLVIYKNNKEVARAIGIINKDNNISDEKKIFLKSIAYTIKSGMKILNVETPNKM